MISLLNYKMPVMEGGVAEKLIWSLHTQARIAVFKGKRPIIGAKFSHSAKD
ncbi:hypothetical protein [Methylomonas sp. AM2-LC]|uniref:hypothetical protein n=1 Tax=Methylomonas sp. AM2-LC TaxID=3153301 RepID=UPI003263F2C2